MRRFTRSTLTLRRRAWLAAALAATALLAGACASGGSSPPQAASVLRADVNRSVPPAGADRVLGKSLTTLGAQLAVRLEARAPHGNLVLSPASLAIAFAMLREGATGASAQQIDSVLHLPANRSDAFNALLRSFSDVGPGNVLSTGDGIFVAQHYAVERTFLQALQRSYNAGVYRTTFPDPATDQVNAYVSKQTHGLIPSVVGPNTFDAGTVMALVNTLYMNARWAAPFDPHLSQESAFTTSTGDHVQVKFMRYDEPRAMQYASSAGWQAVRLPYRGDRLSMLVLVPRGSTDPVKLLAPSVLDRLATGMKTAQVALSLPRWSFESQLDSLPATLQAMGLHAPFGPGGFPKVTTDRSFSLANVIQDARIQVGERGTVAAAATLLMMAGSEPDWSTIKIVDADHPFAYAVVDNATGVPLFEGTVGDPAAS